MLKALSARVLTSMTSAVFGILTARLILGSASVEVFALYALVVGLPMLLQFQDLGAGAALVNAVAEADRPDEDARVVSTLTSVWRITLRFAFAAMAVNVLLLLSGGWRLLLGDSGVMAGAVSAAFTCLAIWILLIPGGVWTRLLLGMRRNHLTILIQGVVAPAAFVSVWVLLHFGSAAHPYLAAGQYVGMVVMTGIGVAVALRLLPNATRRGARQIFQPEAPTARVMDVGWPMMAQLMSAPLAIASQRYVIAQYGTPLQVAEYAAAAQVFMALLGAVNGAGVALWPHFARQRAAGELRKGPLRLSLVMAGGVAAVVGVVLLVRRPLFEFTTRGEVDVSAPVVLAFGSMILLQAFLYPLGMFIMDKPGIRFQTIPVLVMAAGSLGGALLITPSLGVIGPILSNCCMVVGAQIIPFIIYIHRNRSRLWVA